MALSPPYIARKQVALGSTLILPSTFDGDSAAVDPSAAGSRGKSTAVAISNVFPDFAGEVFSFLTSAFAGSPFGAAAGVVAAVAGAAGGVVAAGAVAGAVAGAGVAG